jgi:hypothetical protein
MSTAATNADTRVANVDETPSSSSSSSSSATTAAPTKTNTKKRKRVKRKRVKRPVGIVDDSVMLHSTTCETCHLVSLTPTWKTRFDNVTGDVYSLNARAASAKGAAIVKALRSSPSQHDARGRLGAFMDASKYEVPALDGDDDDDDHRGVTPADGGRCDWCLMHGMCFRHNVEGIQAVHDALIRDRTLTVISTIKQQLCRVDARVVYHLKAERSACTTPVVAILLGVHQRHKTADEWTGALATLRAIHAFGGVSLAARCDVSWGENGFYYHKGWNALAIVEHMMTKMVKAATRRLLKPRRPPAQPAATAAVAATDAPTAIKDTLVALAAADGKASAAAALVVAFLRDEAGVEWTTRRGCACAGGGVWNRVGGAAAAEAFDDDDDDSSDDE